MSVSLRLTVLATNNACRKGKKIPRQGMVSGDHWILQFSLTGSSRKKKAHICAILMHDLEGPILPCYLENAF